MSDEQQTREPGTRKSRKTGNFVRPQKSTEDAFFDTFSEWSDDQQEFALRVLAQIQRMKSRYLSTPEKQQSLPDAGGDK